MKIKFFYKIILQPHDFKILYCRNYFDKNIRGKTKSLIIECPSMHYIIDGMLLTILIEILENLSMTSSNNTRHELINVPTNHLIFIHSENLFWIIRHPCDLVKIFFLAWNTEHARIFFIYVVLLDKKINILIDRIPDFEMRSHGDFLRYLIYQKIIVNNKICIDIH